MFYIMMKHFISIDWLTWRMEREELCCPQCRKRSVLLHYMPGSH